MEQTVSDWEEFVLLISTMERTGRESGGTRGERARTLYRGHADSNWKLETTLERYLTLESCSLGSYYRMARRVKPQLETFLNRTWPLPEHDEYSQWLEENDAAACGELPGYEYFAFLRHHGFPSPFLDWTTSPYIAAFLAMHEVDRHPEHVSIVAFRASEFTPEGRDGPYIHPLGPYAAIDERHFLQQSEYTICVARGDAGELRYVSHEGAIAQSRAIERGIFSTLRIPASQRRVFLKQLDAMNINHFSLFGGIDHLVVALALKEVWLPESWTES